MIVFLKKYINNKKTAIDINKYSMTIYLKTLIFLDIFFCLLDKVFFKADNDLFI